MQLDRHYTDPRLVSIYDVENAGRHDIDFYLSLALELSPEVVVDLGCGTGVLACDLAAAGFVVTGVDPAIAMLDVARGRPGGDLVTWIEGDAAELGCSFADLAVMTGHVAQVFVEDASWNRVLADIFRALRPGGTIAFETRNPAAKGWRGWTRDQTLGRYQSVGDGTFQSWVEVTDVTDGIVRFDGHTVFEGTGESYTSASTLRFRTQDEVADSLTATGFEVRHLWGDWDRGPVTGRSPELIFNARKPIARKP